MAKKFSIDIDFTEGYHLLGIVTQLKDYRLAFFLNDKLDMHLKKYDDLQLSEKGGQYSWYCYVDDENDVSFFLIANHHSKGKLIQAQKMDHFFLVKNMIDESNLMEMISAIRKITGVLAVFKLDMKKLKDLDIMIESIEMHELEQVIKPAKEKSKHR